MAQRLRAVAEAADEQDETDHAEHDDVGQQADQHEAEPDEHAGDAEQDRTAESAMAAGRTHGRSELGILCVERLLDLVQQSLLMLGERHDALLHRLDRSAAACL